MNSLKNFQIECLEVKSNSIFIEVYVMNNELFEKRILFESLSQIMENQKKIMRHLGITKYDSDYGYDDDYTRELIAQCNSIANEIRWKEEEDKNEDFGW